MTRTACTESSQSSGCGRRRRPEWRPRHRSLRPLRRSRLRPGTTRPAGVPSPSRDRVRRKLKRSSQAGSPLSRPARLAAGDGAPSSRVRPGALRPGDFAPPPSPPARGSPGAPAGSPSSGRPWSSRVNRSKRRRTSADIRCPSPAQRRRMGPPAADQGVEGRLAQGPDAAGHVLVVEQCETVGAGPLGAGRIVQQVAAEIGEENVGQAR